MLNKFLKEVIILVVGKQAEEIADLLNNKKHVNEFNIAKKLDITINQTRNILYKISDEGLVSSIRKKDKRKGWYTYFWRTEVFKSLEFLEKHLVKRINQIKAQIRSRETKEFYICERCGIEFNDENALLHNFTCSECGDIFSRKDNSKILREFKRNLEKVEKKLELVRLEIEKEKIKIGKSKAKEIQKEAKEKAKKRAIAAAKRKATREKTLREKQLAEKGNPKKKSSKKKIIKKKITKKKPVKKKSSKKKIIKKKITKKKPVKKKSSKKKIVKKKITKKLKGKK